MGLVLSLGGRRSELELRLAAVMRADGPLQSKGSLELGPVAFLAGELATEGFELLPTRLFVADRAVAIGCILEMAAEIFDLALR